MAENLLKLVSYYLVVCLAMFFAQRLLIYKPSGGNIPPAQFGMMQFVSLDFTMSDGTNIHAWHKSAKKGSKTLVYLHGNAGGLASRAERYRTFARQSDLGILAITYRGYAGSTGKPSEEKIYQDMDEIIKILNEEYKIEAQNLVIYGESLGSGVAVEIASKHNIYALILESPFTSLADVAKLSYWFLPVDLMLRDHYDSIVKTKLVKAPVLIFHAGEDQVVPLSLGEELYESFDKPKKLIVAPNKKHVNLDDNMVIEEINKFLDSLNQPDK